MSSPLPQSPLPVNTTTATEVRPQADPLPSKRGEIGYVDGVHDVSAIPHGNASDVDLPERHPADRGPLQTVPGPSSASPTTSPDIPPPPNNETSTLSTVSITKSAHILFFLKPKKSFGGVQSATIVQFTAQILLLGGTGVAWFFSTKLLQHMASQGENMPAGGSSTVLVHVIFLVAAVVQLVFLERRLFRMRGERYSHKHPGEVLPRHRRIPATADSTTIAFAPWNRPPLPTYAAALSQSGVGTGDVEDNLIAAPPPPAYGNTRGSTLLLQGYLRDSLRVQRPPSVHSQTSTTMRHLSYVSSDEQWEEIQNADRSRQLEDTLNRLQSTQVASPREGRL
ncbi:hypothetical protein HYPSUDRAFT_187841 [Hypholoma sublateritium FD-334 SS-4]|uniref:Uncharacterized protein n=1 Tax=Hypholoma sublateritium (strain FD-334 SS-4) TaxID=945553 RepID=A0A0D2L3B1_HYPSF|nr:hypothetical protein HYPSUDRAFT_187841 [Hypholoma sublateritium FD-334 SS-4]